MISELNEKFNSGLDPNFSTTQETDNILEEEAATPSPDAVIVVGSIATWP